MLLQICLPMKIHPIISVNRKLTSSILLINVTHLYLNSITINQLKLHYIHITFMLLTMVRSPDVRDEIRSFPARAHTMVLCAPDTAGPWSAVTIRHISINFPAYGGSLSYIIAQLIKRVVSFALNIRRLVLAKNIFIKMWYQGTNYLFWNHRSPNTPPIPSPSSNTVVIGTPAYNNSCPLSSQIDVMKEAGLRINPNSRAQL